MDDSLGQVQTHIAMQNNNVLILVVMDDSLGQTGNAP